MMNNPLITRAEVERLEAAADAWRVDAQRAAEICEAANGDRSRYRLRVALYDKRSGATLAEVDPFLDAEELADISAIFRRVEKRREADRDRLLACLAISAENAEPFLLERGAANGK